MLDDGFFQINDIVFNVPPTEIKVLRNSSDHRLENLRTVGASVLKSNFSELNIQVAAVFTDQGSEMISTESYNTSEAGWEFRYDESLDNTKEMSDKDYLAGEGEDGLDGTLQVVDIPKAPGRRGLTGFDKLRHLVSQFRVTPFCYAKNRFLAESIFGKGKDSSMTLALRNMSISMASGDTVNAIKVLFVFSYFNHIPYVYEFRYRKSIFNDVNDNTLDPRESEAWKMFYRAEQKRRNYIPYPAFTSSSGTQIKSTTMSYFQYRMYPANEIKNLLTEVNWIRQMKDFDPQLNKPTMSKWHDDIANRLKLDLSQLKQQEKIARDYLVMTPEEQAVALKLELHTSMIDTDGYYMNLAYEPEQIISQSERWNIFSDNLIEDWQAVRLRDGNFAVLHGNKTPDLTTTAKATKDAIEGDLVLVRRKEKLNLELESIIPIGISINFSNRLATIPLVGNEYPTYQYLGGMDATVSMSFMTTENSAVEKLSKFHSIWKEQRLLMRSIPAGLKKVIIENDLLNMCGLHTFLLQKLEIGTVPGQPETKQIVFDLIENGKPDLSEEKLTFEPMRPGYDAVKFGQVVFEFLMGKLVSHTEGKHAWWRIFEEETWEKKISVRTKLVRKWMSWILDDKFSLLFDEELPHMLEQQTSLQNKRLSTLGYSRTDIAGDNKLLAKPRSTMWNHGFKGAALLDLLGLGAGDYAGTGKYSTFLYTEKSGQELDITEHIALYTLDEFRGDNKLHNYAIRKLLLDFNVIFSRFVIGLLDYYQGNQETKNDFSKAIASSTGSGHRMRNVKKVTVNFGAYSAQKVLDKLDNTDLLGIEEAVKDVKAIIKNVRDMSKLGALKRVQYEKILATHIASTAKWIGNYKDERSRQKYNVDALTENFFEQPFVMSYIINLKGLIKKITTSSTFLDLEAFQGIRQELIDSKASSGHSAYPDFPMNDLLNVIRDDPRGNDFLSRIETKLDSLNNQFMAGNKFIGLNTFFGPDYYLSDIPMFMDQILDRTKLREASNQILEAHQNTKIESYNSWLLETVDGNLGRKKADQLYKELIEIGGTEAGDEAVSDASMIRRARANTNAWLDPQNFGFPAQNTATTQRSMGTDTTDEPTDDVKEETAVKQWMTGVNKIENATDVAGAMMTAFSDIKGMTDSELAAVGIPRLVWPTLTLHETTIISTPFNPGQKIHSKIRKHNGVDIISGKSSKPSNELPIFACAAGEIISISEEGTGKSQTWATYTRNHINDMSDENLRKLNKQVDYDKSGKVNRAGLSIKMKHVGGWTSLYGHLKKDDVYDNVLAKFKALQQQKKKYTVAAGEPIGTVGNTGRSTGAHLHFELRKEGTPVSPVDTILRGRLDKKLVPPSLLQGQQPLGKSYDQLQSSLNAQRGLIRAYPTYKLYFIESDSGERHFFGFDDFFSYQAVQDIQLIRSANNPADLLIIKITNLAGYLTNRRFKDIRQNQNKKGEPSLQASPITTDSKGNTKIAKEDIRNMMHADTAKENPIESLFLKEGTQIQLKLGYNPNPQELETVFDGLIMDIQFHNTDDVMTLICQSFGMELVAGVIGLNEAERFEADDDDEDDRSRTGVIMEELLTYPELKHFGRWEPSSSITGGGSSTQWKPWNLVNKFNDGNVFPPTVGLEDRTDFVAYKTTIWDIAQELTHRHPGYVTYPVSYDGEWGPRMTLFFGLPSGSYVARDSNWDEKETVRLIDLVTRQKTEGISKALHDDILDELTDPSIKNHSANLMKKFGEMGDTSAEDVHSNETWYSNSITGKSYWHQQGMEFAIADKIKMFAKKRQIITPFRKYHLISSEHNLIANNIISSAYSTFNAATIEYSSSEQEVKDQKLQFGEPETLSVVADALIPEEEIREVYAGFENCYGREQAKRYAQALLWKSMKKGYRGSFTITGNPEIKPHDVCYIYDTYTDMHGPIEVEQVVHRFSYHTGFVTEVTPMMCVQTNENATMPTIDVIGLMVEKYVGADAFRTMKSWSKHEEVFAGFLSSTTVSAVGILAGGAMMGATAFVAGTLFAGGVLYGVAALLGMIGDDAPDAEGSTGWFDDLGLFMFRKYVTRTQMAHLFEYSPLVVRGRPLLGGLPTRTKAPGSFIQTWWNGKLKWWNEGKEARPILDFELEMLNNPEQYPDYDLMDLRIALGEEK